MATSRLASPSVAATFQSVITEWMPPGYSLSIAEWPAIRCVDELQQSEHALALANTAYCGCLAGGLAQAERDDSRFHPLAGVTLERIDGAQTALTAAEHAASVAALAESAGQRELADLARFAEAAAEACVDGAWVHTARASALCVVTEGMVRERISEVTAALDHITQQREVALSPRAA